jgi:hypothetical protein
MYCKKCGTKKMDSNFCEKCGSELSLVKNPINRKPFRALIIAIIVIGMAYFLLTFIQNLLSEETQVKNFVKDIVKGEYEKAYKKMDIEEKTLTYNAFKSFIENKDMKDRKVTSIIKGESKEDLDTSLFQEEEPEEKEEKKETFNVDADGEYLYITTKKDKFLFLNTYKIDYESFAKEYEIMLDEKVEMYVGDVKVTRYSSNDGFYTYKPILFPGEYKIKIVTDDGEEETEFKTDQPDNISFDNLEKKNNELEKEKTEKPASTETPELEVTETPNQQSIHPDSYYYEQIVTNYLNAQANYLDDDGNTTFLKSTTEKTFFEKKEKQLNELLKLEIRKKFNIISFDYDDTNKDDIIVNAEIEDGTLRKGESEFTFNTIEIEFGVKELTDGRLVVYDER